MAKINYSETAKLFVEAVGNKENIESYLHCVTRMRFNIIDKEKVNIDKIKKSSLVKGIKWSNNQLQIILGTGIVEKIYQEVNQILTTAMATKTDKEKIKDFKLKAAQNKEGLHNKNGFFGYIQRGIKGLGDIFLPIIPAIVAAGLMMGFATLFKQIGLISANSKFSNIIDILTKTAFDFLIVLVCWSTVKKFGGNPVIGIIVGLMFVSPILPNKSAITLYDTWVKFAEGDINNIEWQKKWETILKIPVPKEVYPWKIGFLSITGYQGSVLPGIFIGIIIAYIEKGLKKIVPNAINIIVTPFLTILFTFTIGIFILGPILLIIENGILIAVKAIINIPYGFGVAFTAGILQAIVITGCHQILQGLEIQLVIDGSTNLNSAGQPIGSIFNAIWTASIISQGGAALAVALKNKAKDEKKLGISSMVSTLFGITEPAIFGTNLPKIKPFLYGLLGGFAGGLFAGIFDVRCQGMGVTVIPGLLLYTGSLRNFLGIIGVNIISFSVALIMTLLFFTNKKIANKNKFLEKIKNIFHKIKIKKNKEKEIK